MHLAIPAIVIETLKVVLDSILVAFEHVKCGAKTLVWLRLLRCQKFGLLEDQDSILELFLQAHCFAKLDVLFVVFGVQDYHRLLVL